MRKGVYSARLIYTKHIPPTIEGCLPRISKSKILEKLALHRPPITEEKLDNEWKTMEGYIIPMCWGTSLELTLIKSGRKDKFLQ